MGTTTGDAWSPETSVEKTRAWGGFVIMMTLWLPVLGVVGGVGVRAFCWAAGL